MQGNFQPCLDNFTLLPANDGAPFHVDSGGGTAWGLTRQNWSRWIGHPASDDEMKAITLAAVSPCYLAWWWNTIAGDELPAGIDLMVFDHGVLAGEVTSVMHLQTVVRVTVDGWMGPETLAGVMNHDPKLLLGMLSWEHETYYRSLAAFPKNPGWISRLDRRVAAAMKMIQS